MVRIDRVTTRGGDGGETSLGDGRRVGKDTARIEALGAVDEANAALGLLRRAIAGRSEDALLARVQNDLFDLGADLAVPGEAGARLRLDAAKTASLEAQTAALNASLPPLASFILPGGANGAAEAHLARTLVRRAERAVVHLGHEEGLNPELLRYLNRLSDTLFVLARHLDRPEGETLWVPGG